jgi:hypothetical protein
MGGLQASHLLYHQRIEETRSGPQRIRAGVPPASAGAGFVELRFAARTVGWQLVVGLLPGGAV